MDSQRGEFRVFVFLWTVLFMGASPWRMPQKYRRFSFFLKPVIVFLSFGVSSKCTNVGLLSSKCTTFYSYNNYKLPCAMESNLFIFLIAKHSLTSWKGYFLSCRTTARQTFQQWVKYYASILLNVRPDWWSLLA